MDPGTTMQPVREETVKQSYPTATPMEHGNHLYGKACTKLQ